VTGFFDPLEQFEFGCFLCVHNSKFIFFLYLVGFILSFFVFFKKNKFSSFLRLKQIALSKIFSFILSVVRENLKTKYGFVFNNVFILFLLIFLSNIVGMVPYSFTLTSSVVLTFFLSFQFFFGVTVFAVLEHRAKVVGFFLPPGVPIVVAPFLVVIELISFFARVLSLAIRLFANIMSGHSLLKILAGFVWIMLFSGLGLFSIFPLIVVFLVTFLEMVIAFLQAYVFMILVIIYVNDAALLH
jgi:ATP synthase subunit 6